MKSHTFDATDIDVKIKQDNDAIKGISIGNLILIILSGCFVVATFGMVVVVHSDVSDIKESTKLTEYFASAVATGLDGGNYCTGAKPTAANYNNVDCATEAVEQAGGDVTLNADGTMTKGNMDVTTEPIKVPYFKEGLCPVNVHWHLGAEHKSDGEFDAAGTGPTKDDAHRRLRANSADVGEGVAGTTTSSGRQLAGDTTRLGGRCHHYDSHNPAFTAAYDWKHCVDMTVGETYEVHWPHSDMGACGTPLQYQTPFYDGVFCKLDQDQATAGTVGSAATGKVALTSTVQQIGVQAQVFTIVNDENYYYPDLMRGMIVDGTKGAEITAYTGSTTGTTRNNQLCSAFAPITWHVDRKCHLISASSFDKMCADMKAQQDDMSGDLYAHGAREVVTDTYVANNQENIKAAYIA